MEELLYMKQVKLYNMFFPVWMFMFLPPIVIVTLVINFIIDSAVLMGFHSVFKLGDAQIEPKEFYKRNIKNVWMFGFLADFIGAIILYIVEW
jgi:hypothetical protein